VIRGRILKGKLPLGAELSRRKLAAELGMSLLPVAEALQRLENERLVESRPRIGTRVYLPTAEDIRERYEVREALEAQAARLYAQKATDRERVELLEMAGQMDAMFNRYFNGDNDPDFLFEAHSYHNRLHFRIAECARCEALRDAIEKNHVLIINWLYDIAADRPHLPPQFHRELIEALNEGDPEKADRSMRQHVRYGRETVVRTIDSSQSGARAGIR
jgi:DNA-binding GntR family transcriptional regulator